MNAPARIVLTALLAMGGSHLLSGCGAVQRRGELAPTGEEPIVRVLIAESLDQVRLASSHPLNAGAGSSPLWEYPNGLLVVATPEGVSLVDPITGEERPLAGDVLVTSPGAGIVDVGGSPYRGSISVRRASGGGLDVINILEMESYLLGVVPGEIGRLPSTRIEAVKAQAVAARTYALSSLGQYGARGFDLHASVQDQIYEGMMGEDPTADAAVTATAGLVLAYRKRLARTYYFSTCGGRTADIEEVWGERFGSPYLKGIADRSLRRAGQLPFCVASPNYSWNEEWDGRTLNAILQRYLPGELRLPSGEQIGALTDIKVLRRGRSGRVQQLQLETSRGSYVVGQDRIRWVLRRPGEKGAILRSSLIRIEEVQKEAGRVTRLAISGRGNGHGVGMCQYGAIGMAEAGYRFEEILRHYYSGAKVVHVSDAEQLSLSLRTNALLGRILAWTRPGEIRAIVSRG